MTDLSQHRKKELGGIELANAGAEKGKEKMRSRPKIPDRLVPEGEKAAFVGMPERGNARAQAPKPAGKIKCAFPDRGEKDLGHRFLGGGRIFSLWWGEKKKEDEERRYVFHAKKKKSNPDRTRNRENGGERRRRIVRTSQGRKGKGESQALLLLNLVISPRRGEKRERNFPLFLHLRNRREERDREQPSRMQLVGEKEKTSRSSFIRGRGGGRGSGGDAGTHHLRLGKGEKKPLRSRPLFGRRPRGKKKD